MSAGNNAFSPGATVSVATVNGTATSLALTALTPTRSRQILVTSGGATPVMSFIKFGTSSAVSAATTDTPILPASAQLFTVSADTTHVSVAAGATTGIIYFTTGDGM